MSVRILIIAHPGIGNALVDCASATFAKALPLSVSSVDVQQDFNTEKLVAKTTELVSELDQGDGILILTDLFGATPSNIARQAGDKDHIRVVSGLNLPMLLNVLNYPDLTLAQLTEKALEGGCGGIFECESE